MDILVNLLGLVLIVSTVWWFLLSRPGAVLLASTRNVVDIRVKDGVYQPSQIRVPAHKALTLRFLRQDPAPCAETVVFNHINRHYLLPLNKVVEVKLDPQPAGEMDFTCEMGMYRGRLLIE